MGWWQRFGNLRRRRQVAVEIEDELASHIEMAVEDAMRGGMNEAEARRMALLRFGNRVAIQETTLGADAMLGLDGLWRDVKLALRQLKSSPAFAATAILTLALGIGATTAIFTLTEHIMMRSLPVDHPEQLWRIGDSNLCCYQDGYRQGDWNLFSWEAYRLFRANTPAFENLAAFQIGMGNAELALRRAGSSVPAETNNGEYVSGNFFRTLGISPWRGRLFTDADDQEGAAPVAVMSFRTWQEKYGADPSIVGETYQVNGHPFTLIGITPPGFFGAKIDADNMPGIWLPLAAEPLIAGGSTRLKDPRIGWLDVIGRARPGTNPTVLEAQLQGELRQWLAGHVTDMYAQEKPEWQKQTLHLTAGGSGVSPMRENYADRLKLLSAAAVCVLLVACANIANLLLARGMRNRSQAAIRAALGASRTRLVRGALAESLTLSIFGGLAGIAVACVGVKLLLRLVFHSDALLPVSAAPSMPALIFALATAMFTGIIFGVAPAWISAQAQPIAALRGTGRSGSTRAGNARPWMQNALVIAQVAVSFVLLSVAAMLGQSLRNLEHQDFGFQPEGRYLVSIDPKLSNYKQEQLAPFFNVIEDRLRAIPGVRGVGSSLHATMSGTWAHEITLPGASEAGQNDDADSNWTRVTPGYFEAIGNRIVAGRAITEEDHASSQPVAVINEAFAKKFFGGRNPIGQHFGPTPQKNANMYEVVGVAANLAYLDDSQPLYFLPEAQQTHFDEKDTQGREVWSHYLYNIVVEAPGNHPEMQAQMKKALADVDPDLVMYDVQSYAERIHADFAQEKTIAVLTWLFGAVALVLAAVGLYGVTAYAAEQRASEIGVRIALGASCGRMMCMILQAALLQTGIGAALGIPAAIAAGLSASSQLFGVRPWSPIMLGFATGLMLITTIAAAAIPARRAAWADPLRSLRNE